MTIRGIRLLINGEEHNLIIRDADTLLTVLRDKIGLTGAKPGCLNGDCGSCTVIVGNKPMKSCLMLAVESEYEEIVTIEGLSGTPVQKAFVEFFAFQCGYCTPGFIMNCQALINENPDADFNTMKEWLKSNICRCTSYEEIEKAVIWVLGEKTKR